MRFLHAIDEMKLKRILRILDNKLVELEARREKDLDDIDELLKAYEEKTDTLTELVKIYDARREKLADKRAAELQAIEKRRMR